MYKLCPEINIYFLAFVNLRYNTIEKDFQRVHKLIIFLFLTRRFCINIRSNVTGRVNAIPIIVYHQIGSEGGGGIDNGGEGQGTDVNLFAQEMKFLYDNGFTVLTMANLRYNQNDNSLYIPGITAGAPSG